MIGYDQQGITDQIFGTANARKCFGFMLNAPRLMVFFVAFENGFFWKGYLARRQEEVRQSQEADKGV